MNQWINESLNQWTDDSVKQWTNEPMIQWNNEINESMHGRFSESMNQRANESVNQWTNEVASRWTNESAMIQWINEAMNRWIHETMIQWINDSVNRWFSESSNQCTSELVIRWINEPMMEWMSNESKIIKESMNYNESMNQWMKGWMGELLFFVELLLHWATLPRHLFLSYFFSGQPLIWATSALSCLPASYFVASATQFFSSRSCYAAFCSLQLQCILSPPVANRHSWSVAPNRPTLTQRWQWGWFRVAPKVLFFLWNWALATHFADLIFQKCYAHLIF